MKTKVAFILLANVTFIKFHYVKLTFFFWLKTELLENIAEQLNWDAITCSTLRKSKSTLNVSHQELVLQPCCNKFNVQECLCLYSLWGTNINKHHWLQEFERYLRKYIAYKRLKTFGACSKNAVTFYS